MTHGRKTGGRNFKKGNVANPRGAGAHNDHLKKVRKLTHDELADMGALLLGGSMQDLMALQKDPSTSVLKMLMGAIIAKAINKGDYSALNALLDRIVGKVKDRVEFSGPNDGPIAVTEISPKERRAMIAELDRKLKLTQGEA